MLAPTVDDLGAHLNMSPAQVAAQEDELEVHLTAAVEFVETQTRPLREVTRTLQVAPTSNGTLVLFTPITEVVSVTDPGGHVWTPSELDVDFDAGVIYLTRGYWFGVSASRTRFWDVVVKAGSDDAPASLVLATLFIAAHLWESQRSTAGRPAPGGGADMARVSAAFAIPNRAAELMAPYKAAAIA